VNTTSNLRFGWDTLFAEMHAEAADKLLLPEYLDGDFLEEAWE
jgi:hypothetical protein